MYHHLCYSVPLLTACCHQHRPIVGEITREMLGFMRELETGPRVEHNINPKAGLYSNGVPCCYITIGISKEDGLHCFLVRDQ